MVDIQEDGDVLGSQGGRPWTDRAGSYPLPCPLDWREGRKLDLIKKMNT